MNDSEWQKLINAALEQGWTIEPKKKCHLKWTPPHAGGPVVFTSATPSDYRAVRNARSDLRRAGLII